MNLHQHLRDLVARQGPNVVDTAETFRAALDDFLTEDEATTGELNLLVDAVRLGAVVRLRSILSHGGSPQAAVEEAGDAFARDRGTDDLPRCRWAVAVVGYALGLVEAADVPPTGPQSIPITGVPTSPPPPPPSHPSTLPPSHPPSHPSTLPPPPYPPSERPAAPAPDTAHTPRTFPNTQDLAPAPVPIAPGPRPRRSGRMVLVAVLVAAIVAAAVGVGIWLGSRDDDPNQAADDNSSEPTGGDDTSGDDTGGTGTPDQGGISAESVLVPVTEADGVTKIYEINVDTQDYAPLTDGPDDRGPSISPDRKTLIYLETTEGESSKPMVWDLEAGTTRPLLGKNAPCEFAGRPSFNPAGNRVVVLCLDEFGGYTGMYVLDLRGQYISGFPLTGEPNGSPTWTSGNTVAWTQNGLTESDPTTLWEAEVGGTQPTQLTDGSEGWDTHADWSEEAGLLLFSRHEDARPFGDLLTMDADGNPGPSAAGVLWGHPAWSADGESVVFVIRNEDGSEQLATASIDGDGFTEPELLAEDLPGDTGIPAWGTR